MEMKTASNLHSGCKFKRHSLYKAIEIPIQILALDITGLGDLLCNLNFSVADIISPKIKIISVISPTNKDSGKSMSKHVSILGIVQGL